MTVGSLEPTGELQSDFKQVGLETFALGCTGRADYSMAAVKLIRWLKRNEIDAVHTHLFDASLVGLLAATIANIPLRIMTAHHTIEMQFYPRSISFRLDRFAYQRLANRIVAPSQYVKSFFVEKARQDFDKVAVINHGFDFEQGTAYGPSKIPENNKFRSEFQLNEKIIIVAIGRIFWIKDYASLIEGFALSCEKIADTILLIVGDGDNSRLVALATSLGVIDRVAFTGKRNDVADILQSADIFIHTSIAESFGMVILEAMGAGKPIVSTRVGIAAEIIQNDVNGILIDAESPADVANGIRAIISRKERWTEMGAMNAKIASTFTSERMAREHEIWYEKWRNDLIEMT